MVLMAFSDIYASVVCSKVLLLGLKFANCLMLPFA